MSPIRAWRLTQAGVTAGLLIWVGRVVNANDLLDPTSIPKYVENLIVPPVMPPRGSQNIDDYEIAVRQFDQQILPAGFPATAVWGYGAVQRPDTFHYPSFTIEARYKRSVRVKWVNGLKDAGGSYLPHLLPVDQTLHWANPPGGEMGRDMRGDDPTPYTGPVPIVPHVHGAHVGPESDGYPEAWFLPDAQDIPGGYATVGSHFDQFDRGNTQPGTAVFQYPNDQRATTLWYHDHTLGMTRLNVYSGPAGFYLVRGGPQDLPAGMLPEPAPRLNEPPGTSHYEIPIVIQDRTFNASGSLFYPADRAFFEGLQTRDLRIPFIPDPACGGRSDVSPIWNPEFFGNMMVVNGRTWPVVAVEPRRYRFRLLNGCNSRFLILRIVTGDPTVRPATTALNFWQIGAEGGFLPDPVELPWLLMGLAERADVIVDFSGLAVGTELFLINEAPDEPFGEPPDEPSEGPWADPQTTGQVLKFVVTPLASNDTSTPPAQLRLPRFDPLGQAVRTRQLSLSEAESQTVLVRQRGHRIVLNCRRGVPFGPTAAMLGTLNSDDTPNPLRWMDPPTETPTAGDIEIWEIHNHTEDAHPIHIHLVQFEVLDRTPMGEPIGGPATRPREPWESGFKDTVIAFPDEVTRLKAEFDIPGLFVWHCHIVEHEDNEMMRPYVVLPRDP